MTVSDIAIEVQDLSKEYRRGAARRENSLRDELAGLLRRPFTPADAQGDAFWALQGVSFTVRRGEIVGICGRNGAGKSTLLKILSRVTEPTRGRARLRGRVSSLLEVGTGFHGDLTGRENVFLNGALLGLSGREVRGRLDEIVAFSGVEKFLDTPVRHYSSGMQARLGFAVAAHLDQEILILDEVLAVGDATFQRKCLQRVDEIAHGGKTILLVSHNMFAIERYCSRALLLVDGRVHDDGPPRRIIDQYLVDIELGVSDEARPGDETVVGDVTVETDAGPGRLHGMIGISVALELLRDQPHLACGLGIYNTAGQLLANATADFHSLSKGRHRLAITLANPGLPPGNFFLGIAVMRRQHWIKLFERAASFRIPSTVTDDPHMLDMLDLAGIAMRVTRAELMDVRNA